MFSCVAPTQVKKEEKTYTIFSNKGFALLYNDDLKKKNKISNTLDERSLKIFQKNLKEDTIVKISNLKNEKYLLASVGQKTDYPAFYNAVFSKRIFDELEIDIDEPYIEIVTVNQDGLFIAKKAKTFDEEKKVADKAPIDGITIKDLNQNTEKIVKKNKKNNFKYIIKIGDFYFKDTADLMSERIKNETNTKEIKILSLSKTQYRVFLGPFDNLKSLKKAFNDISIIDFENLEIIKK